MSTALRVLARFLATAIFAAAFVQNLPAEASPRHRRPEGGRVLSTSDVLQISVVNQAELNTTARIEPDGSIVFPYVGRIAAAGFTEDQIKEKIRAGLKKADVVKDPQVLVEVTTFGNQVTVQGAIGTPGSFVLDRPTSLTEALARAGGLREETGAGDVLLRRRRPNGEIEVRHYDAKAILNGTSPARTVMLTNNDEIYVEQGAIFYLYGYVARPGQYPLNRPGMSVQQALSAAGGLSPLGSDWRIEIRRRTAAGAMLDLPAALDDFVEPNDTIVVNERLF
jgi:polysaccharide biosynthesis/export protein